MSSQILSTHMPRAVTAGLLSLGLSFSLAACRQAQLADTELQALQTASDVYRAYERGDCGTVQRLTGEEQLSAWEQTELRYSLSLAKGFCFEREGDLQGAMSTYKMLEENAGRTFAAADAAERVRTLQVLESDPEYRRWVEEAIANAKPNDLSRTPVSRIPAEFPPAARAAGIEGFAIVEFGVNTDGETTDPVVVASNPPLIFDGTSLRAVRQWRFVEELDSLESQRQVIRILFRVDYGITVDDAQRLIGGETKAE